MKKRILDRYETMPDGNVIIDVAARRVEELYQNFDKCAPYHRKDFDDDLVEYLTGCVREIGGPAFVVRFTIEQGLSKELMETVRSGMHSFFMYRLDVEFAAMKKMIRTSSLLLLSGIVILAVSLWVNRFVSLNGNGSFLYRFFAEGLTIVAWVSIWEGLATFLLNLTPHLFRIRVFRWLAAAPVSFSPGVHSG
ncbi:MAG: hypothetical protein JW989_03265 [Chlorobiaceae bacterium]|nr:hypothetical protein [Chlorobiaceae bacterium]